MKILNKLIEKSIIDRYYTPATRNSPDEFDNEGFEREAIYYFEDEFENGKEDFFDAIKDIPNFSENKEMDITVTNKLIENTEKYYDNAGKDFLESVFECEDYDYIKSNEYYVDAIEEFLYWFKINFNKKEFEFNEKAVTFIDKNNGDY